MLRLFNKRAFSTSIKARFPLDNQSIGERAEASKQEKNIGDKLDAKMDGDSSARTMDKGANSALGATDLTDGIHEAGNQSVSLPTSMQCEMLMILTECRAQKARRRRELARPHFTRTVRLEAPSKQMARSDPWVRRSEDHLLKMVPLGSYFHFLLRDFRVYVAGLTR